MICKVLFNCEKNERKAHRDDAPFFTTPHYPKRFVIIELFNLNQAVHTLLTDCIFALSR